MTSSRGYIWVSLSLLYVEGGDLSISPSHFICLYLDFTVFLSTWLPVSVSCPCLSRMNYFKNIFKSIFWCAFTCLIFWHNIARSYFRGLGITTQLVVEIKQLVLKIVPEWTLNCCTLLQTLRGTATLIEIGDLKCRISFSLFDVWLDLDSTRPSRFCLI